MLYRVAMPHRIGASGALLVAMLGCSDDAEPCERWQGPRDLGLGTSAQLLAIDRDMVVGAGASVWFDGEAQTMPAGVDADLLAVLELPYFEGRDYIAVGTKGTLLCGRSESYSGPLTWTKIDLGTNADLRAVAAFELQDNLLDYHVVVVGEGVLFERTPSYGANFEILFDWTTPEPPAEGWGSLRGVKPGNGSSAVAVGDGGRVITRAPYELPDWTIGDIGTSEDLLAYCSDGLDERAFGRAGRFFARKFLDTWKQVDLGIDEDLVACDQTFVLTASGRVLDIDIAPDEPSITELAAIPGLRGLNGYRDYGDQTLCVRAVGDRGVAIEICPC